MISYTGCQQAYKSWHVLMQGSIAAQELRDNLRSTHSTLVSTQERAASVQQTQAKMVMSVEESLHGHPNGQQVQAPGKKPNKGVSKSKRAALVLDAMQPLLAPALNQVQSSCLLNPWLACSS